MWKGEKKKNTELHIQASASDATPMLNREKNSEEPPTGPIHYSMAVCVLYPLHLSKSGQSLSVESAAIPGISMESESIPSIQALQEINTGRSTCRAFPFLCDLNTVMWKAGLETAHTQSDPDGAALFQRHRKQKTEPLFVPGASEPTSEYQSVSIQVPSQMLLRTHSRSAGSARLHITQRQLRNTHPHMQSRLCRCEGFCAN